MTAFLNLNSQHFGARYFFVGQGMCPVHHRMFFSAPGLYPVCGGAATPPCDNGKCLQAFPRGSEGSTTTSSREPLLYPVRAMSHRGILIPAHSGLGDEGMGGSGE